ncbi:MAG TPA: HD-GYP domain-containing protein [Planctomycetota bacterium]
MSETEEAQGFDDLVTLLSQGIAQRVTYFATHPRVQQPAREFAARLATLLQEQHREFFFLGFVEGNLVHEGRFLIGPTIFGRRVVDMLEAIGSGGILLKAGVTADEMIALFGIAADLRAGPCDLAQARASLQQRKAVHVQFSPPYSDPDWFGQFLYEGAEPMFVPGAGGDSLSRMVPVYQRMFDAVDAAHALTRRDAGIDIDGVRSIGEQLLAAAGDTFTDVMQLVRYPDYDTFTVGHSVRVASIAVLVGHSVGLPRELQIELATAGMLHDVGKSKVPDEILYKAGRLDPDERQLIERHPVLGAQILLENRQASHMAIAGAFGHHLRHDGRGYPSLPDWGVSSRITALLKVCDVFEALTAVRPYKGAMSPRRAYEIMVKDRGCFDPGAFRALVAAMGLYPPGTRVLLSSGEVGVVTKAGARIDSPFVRVTHDAEGAVLDQEVVREVGADDGSLQVTLALSDRPAKQRATSEPAPEPTVCTHTHADAAHDATVEQISKRRRE